MATFVLVHGGRHGGWCWKRVFSRLENHGHKVYTPTNTGLGERSHLLSANISLQTHIDDIVNVLEWEDLVEVVLVGHSYGGIVISGAAQSVPHRIAHLVYLDAVMPRDGESILDIATPEKAAMLRSTIDGPGQGWCLPPLRPASDFGVTDPDDAAWVDSKVSTQPAKTYLEAITSTAASWTLPGTFIECSQPIQDPPPISRTRARERADTDDSFSYVVLDTGHDAMITAPDAVTDILLGTLRQPSVRTG